MYPLFFNILLFFGATAFCLLVVGLACAFVLKGVVDAPDEISAPIFTFIFGMVLCFALDRMPWQEVSPRISQQVIIKTVPAEAVNGEK